MTMTALRFEQAKYVLSVQPYVQGKYYTRSVIGKRRIYPRVYDFLYRRTLAAR